MSRMSLIAFAAMLAVGSLFPAVQAQAFDGYGHRGYFHGPRRVVVSRSVVVYRWHRPGWRFGYRPFWPRVAGPYFYPAYAGCYRLRRVWTPYGIVLRRVNVCYPYRPYFYG